MSDPQDMGFELDGVLFGKTGPILVKSFDPGTATWRTQSSDRPAADGRQFGRDYSTPADWTWELEINESSDVTALARLEAFQAVWRADDTRQTPGAVKALQYRLGGRTRVVYGRPRRFSYPLDIRHLQGAVSVTADFERADDLFYESTRQQVQIGMAPASRGGLRSPVKSPVRSVNAGATTRAGQFTVGGVLPTWATVRFNGPVSGARALVDGVLLAEYTGSLAYDETAEIDARPWVTAMTVNGAAGYAGNLGDTWMDLMRLEPGPHELSFTGYDTTGSATVELLWQNASGSL